MENSDYSALFSLDFFCSRLEKVKSCLLKRWYSLTKRPTTHTRSIFIFLKLPCYYCCYYVSIFPHVYLCLSVRLILSLFQSFPKGDIIGSQIKKSRASVLSTPGCCVSPRVHPWQLVHTQGWRRVF